MEFLLWILLGIAAGWMISIFMGTSNTYGLVTDVVLGVIGALTGGLILVFIQAGSLQNFSLYSLIIIGLGSVLLVWLGRMINSPAR